MSWQSVYALDIATKVTKDLGVAEWCSVDNRSRNELFFKLFKCFNLNLGAKI